jgi:hypothetical protein
VEQEFIDWLLESRIPSIRYLTLSALLARPSTDAGLQTAQQEIITTGPVPAILAGQTDNGAWAGDKNYYQPKYTSTHWSMMLLAELAADPADERLQRGADYMLEVCSKNPLPWLANKTYGLSCFWGNMLRYVAHCGRADDPRAEPFIDYLVRDVQNQDCHCPINAHLPCAWGAARALWGLAALPPGQRSAEVEAAIQTGLNFLLDSAYDLVKADYPTPGNINRRWFSLNFPLFYQADILFVLRLAAELDALDRRGAQSALAWLEAIRHRSGRWTGASPYRSRTYPELGAGQETDRWASLHAAIVMQKAGMMARSTASA